MSTPQLEDIPDEIILKVLGYLEIKDLLCICHVSKSLRAISQDETLWKQISLCWNECIVPAEFLDKVLQNGCKYLDLRYTQVHSNLSPETKSKLRYLAMGSELGPSELHEKIYSKSGDSRNSRDAEDYRDFEKRLLKSCHSLQKLQINDIDHGMVEAIYHQNSKTLEALDISFGYYMQPELIKHITRYFVELKELAFECYNVPDEDLFIQNDMEGVVLQRRSINYLVNNLTTKIEKLCLSNADINDEQVKTLVTRCKKLSVLDLSHKYHNYSDTIRITDNSLTHIIEQLKPTLEELNVEGCENLSYNKLVQLRSMPHLKKLNCCRILNNGEDVQRLQSKMPHVEFTKSDGENHCCKFRQWIDDRKRIWELSSNPLDLHFKNLHPFCLSYTQNDKNIVE